MSIIGLGLNILLAVLLLAALGMGWRLNRRLKTLRDSHDGFAVAVRELNAAAARAEQGLSDLRAATDEAIDVLADRIEKGRALAAKLERLTTELPEPAANTDAPLFDSRGPDSRGVDRRLGALLAASREVRGRDNRPAPPSTTRVARPGPDDDLFEDAAPKPSFSAIQGGRS